MNTLKTSRALGWTSLAIAATEIFGQGMVEEKLLGIDQHPALLRSLGLREAAAGITILSQKEITPTLAAGLWSRVVGDAMDVALLAMAAPRTRRPGGFATNLLTVLGITALDAVCAWKVHKQLMESDRRGERSSASDERSTSSSMAYRQ